MKCGETRNKINDYCDGELNASQIQALEAHVLKCADCAKALAEARKIFDGLQKMGQVKAPENLAGDVRRKLETLQGKKSGLKKIFSPLPFKIPLELAASLLIGVFIYRVIVPHYPIGKSPHLEVKVDPSVRDKTAASPSDIKSAAENAKTSMQPGLLPLVKEPSPMPKEKSDANLNREYIQQKQETAASEENQVLNRKRAEVQKDFSEKEKSVSAVFEEKDALPAGESLEEEAFRDQTVQEGSFLGLARKPDSKLEQPKAPAVSPGASAPLEKSANEHPFRSFHSEESLAESKMSPPMTVKMDEPVKPMYREGFAYQEKFQEQSASVPGVISSDLTQEAGETQGGASRYLKDSSSTDASLSLGAASKGRSQENETVSQSLKSFEKNSVKEEKPQVIASIPGQESQAGSASFGAQPAVQPAAIPEKAKIQKETRDQKSLRHYVWEFTSEEIRKEMFLMIQKKGWKVESRTVRTFQISLPQARKDEFLEWLGLHGRLLDIEETANPENSDMSQMIILDLEFEEAS